MGGLPKDESRLPKWLPFALAAPALIPAANAYLAPRLRGEWPTGFIQYDMAYYMANAREYFDQGFQLTYGNPYAPYGTPAIYSQPHILLLGILERLGLEPGIAFNLFGLAAAAFAIFAGIRLYRALVGLGTTAKVLGLVCFIWGGGVLVLAGLATSLATGQVTLASLMRFDPFNGWWMLNFGRNLVYPTEAYYHGLFLFSILFLIRRRFAACLVLAALLSWSHPFSGLSLALILFVYAAVEWRLRSGAVMPVLLAGSAAILACHLSYYVVFLNRFPSHRSLRNQWSLEWLYQPPTFVAALLLVGMFAAMRLTRAPGFRQALREPQVRLLLVWFVVVFALSKHELVVKPFQPIHFTHGYDWMALFFLGAPVLIELLERLLAIPATGLRAAAVTLFVTVLLLDNAVWLSGFLFPSPIAQPVVLSMDQKSLLDWLAGNTAPPDIILCDDPAVSYLVNTYTSARSWYGHVFNTPEIGKRQSEAAEAFHQMQFKPDWARMHMIYIANRETNWQPPVPEPVLFQNSSFMVWGTRQQNR